MPLIEDLDSVAKTQKVRAFDIYALGPFLIWVSMRKKPLGRWTRRTLLVAGVMTVVYNWKRYRALEKAIAENKGDVFEQL